MFYAIISFLFIYIFTQQIYIFTIHNAMNIMLGTEDTSGPQDSLYS